jgi:hypothetical protein
MLNELYKQMGSPYFENINNLQTEIFDNNSILQSIKEMEAGKSPAMSKTPANADRHKMFRSNSFSSLELEHDGSKLTRSNSFTSPRMM